MKQQQTGFTLIELVVVIVVLGILAAFALPRFSDITTEARRATLQGLAGGVRSAAALAHAQQLAQGIASNLDITMETQIVNMTAGYPSATAGGIQAALIDTSGFTLNGTAFELDGAPTPSACSVNYPVPAGSFPTVTITSTGC